MPRERLTPDRIRRFTCPDGTKQAFLWDSVSPRLAVRATAGTKAFIFEAKLSRQTIRRTIGDVRVWNVDDARAEANRLTTLVDQGVDPRELERQQKEAKAALKVAAEAAKADAERRQRFTLRALCDAYTDALQRARKEKSAAATRSAFKCHVFPHNEIALSSAREVTAHQIAAIIRKVREDGKERAAGILRSYLSAAYNAAKRAPFDSSLPSDLIAFEIEHNPVDAVPAIPVRRGDRTLSANELRAYVGFVRRVGRADTVGIELPDQALLLALFAGGQRMAQLLRAKIGDFESDTCTLRLWDGKGKRAKAREHLLPLAPKGAAIAADLVRRAKTREQLRAAEEGRKPDMTGLWLFSTYGRVPMTETTPGKRVAEISAAMHGEPFDLRDIRRTCETMLAGMGVSRDTRAQLLSHGISGVQAAHYDRHGYMTEKRVALLAWEAQLDRMFASDHVAPAPVEA